MKNSIDSIEFVLDDLKEVYRLSKFVIYPNNSKKKLRKSLKKLITKLESGDCNCFKEEDENI